MRQFAKQRKIFIKSTKKIFTTIWDMCTPVLRVRGKLKKLDNFWQMEVQRNPVVLLRAVGSAVCGREEHRQLIYSLVQLQKILILFHQWPGQSNEDYKEAFEVLWDMFVAQGG